jgi:hypothetical protein
VKQPKECWKRSTVTRQDYLDLGVSFTGVYFIASPELGIQKFPGTIERGRRIFGVIEFLIDEM